MSSTHTTISPILVLYFEGLLGKLREGGFSHDLAESRRHDLSKELTEFLGEDRADTLMTYLLSQESTDLATKADLDTLKTAVTGRLDIVDHRLEAINHRLDRMVFALVAGPVAIIATLVAQSFI